MALVRVTTTARVSAGDTLIPVSSTATGFPPVGLIVNPQQAMFIDDEAMFVVSVPVANSVLVRTRGADGTIAAAHDIGASVITSTTATDFPALGLGQTIIRPESMPDIATYGQDGAITVPGATAAAQSIAYIAKTSAAALTLGAPSLVLNGIQVTITSQTAFAHVVTATQLINPGSGVPPLTTITFPAIVGASVTLIAQNGLWNVQSLQGAVVFT